MSHLQQSLVVIVMYFLPLTSLARYSILAPTALLIQLINYEIRYGKSTPRSGKKAVFLLQFRYPVRLPVKNTRDALLFNQVISFSVCAGVTDNYCFYRPYTLHTAVVVCGISECRLSPPPPPPSRCWLKPVTLSDERYATIILRFRNRFFFLSVLKFSKSYRNTLAPCYVVIRAVFVKMNSVWLWTAKISVSGFSLLPNRTVPPPTTA